MAQRDLSSGQIANIVGVCTRKINQYIDSGEIKGYRLPSRNETARHRRAPFRSVVEFCLRHGVPVTVPPGWEQEYDEILANLSHLSPPSPSPPPTAVTVVPTEENFS